MIYQQYTITRGHSYLVFYYCSKCRKLNVFKHTVSAAAQFNSKGAFFQAQLDYRQDNAEDIADEKLMKRYQKVLSEDVRGIYRSAGYQHKCEHCGHMEPWSQLRHPYIELASKASVYLAFFTGCFWALSKFENSPQFLIPLVIAAIPWIIKIIRIIMMETRIRKLDQINLPRICDHEQLVHKTYNEMLELDPLKNSTGESVSD